MSFLVFVLDFLHLTFFFQACPEGHWCSESTVVPNKCDPLSYCPYGSGYQINFMSTLFMLLLSSVIFFTSYRLVSKQQKKNNISRLKDPSGNDEVSVSLGVTSTSNGNLKNLSNVVGSEKHAVVVHKSLVEVSFQDLLFQVPDDSHEVSVYMRACV